MEPILRWLAVALVCLALVSSGALLVRGTKVEDAVRLPLRAISGVPLLAVGLSFLVLQPMIRPRRAELLKNLLLSATFLLWGVVQWMAPSFISAKLGDVVVILYVVDLAWTILTRADLNAKRFSATTR
jgi:hypothetical protein